MNRARLTGALIALLVLLSACAPPALLPMFAPSPTPAPTATQAPTPSPAPVPSPLEIAALAKEIVNAVAAGGDVSGNAETLKALPGGREALAGAVVAEGTRMLEEKRSYLPRDYLGFVVPWEDVTAWYDAAEAAGLCAPDDLTEARAEVLDDAERQAVLREVGKHLRDGDISGIADAALRARAGTTPPWVERTLKETSAACARSAELGDYRGSRSFSAYQARYALALWPEAASDALAACLAPDHSWLEGDFPPLIDGWLWRDLRLVSHNEIEISYELFQFDELYPEEYMRAQTLPGGKRARMEKIIRRWAALYPPDHLRTHVAKVLCLDSMEAVRYDGDDDLVLTPEGELIFDPIVGASDMGVLIITDNFSSDALILRALVHETAHLEMDGAGQHDALHPIASFAAKKLERKIRELNGDFQYYYDRPDISVTSDIPGWRSTDTTGDYQSGWARSYGQLSFAEDVATLTEKLILHGPDKYRAYDTLYQKLLAVAEYRAELHPDFTPGFFQTGLNVRR